jgi:hypothetical protein
MLSEVRQAQKDKGSMFSLICLTKSNKIRKRNKGHPGRKIRSQIIPLHRKHNFTYRKP